MGSRLQGSHESASQGRVFAFPNTFLGGWSLKLLVGWVGFLVLAFVAVALHGGSEATRRMSMAAGGKFYSLPSVAVPMAAGLTSGIAAFFVALVAIIWKGERSIAMLVPIVLGGLVLLFVIGEFFE